MKKILIISAHPDDAELSMGMAISDLIEKGHSVYILCLSRGGRGSTEKRYREIRQHEAERAGKILGIKNYLFSDIEDTKFIENRSAVRSEIEKYVLKINPDEIYTHFPIDIHLDHSTTGSEVLVASRAVNSLIYFRSPNSNNFIPNMFFFGDEKLLIKKYKALKCFKSQFNINIEFLKSVSSTAMYNWMDFKSVLALRHSRSIPLNQKIYCEPFVLGKMSFFSSLLDRNKSGTGFDTTKTINL